MMFRNKQSEEKFYKFKDLKIYSSPEWLANGMRKYRTVFESIETSYLYVELSFYNKLFDVEEWEAEFLLKCYRLSNRKEREIVCEINVNQVISPQHNIVNIREGWGNDEVGTFWTRGDYVWEVYLDGEIFGTKPFYIESGGPVTPQNNPYFEMQTIKLYEGTQDGVEEENRIYHKQFSAAESKYIWVEFNFENLQEDDFYCELTFNIYNETRQLKGQTIELKKIEQDEDFIEIISGYGSDVKGSWIAGHYTLEVIFMDRLIAIVPFEVGKKFVTGNTVIYPPSSFLTGRAYSNPAKENEESEEEETYEQVVERLNNLIGLKDLKKRIHDYTSYLQFTQIRQEKGLKEDKNLNLHLIFKGNPGTGKTTIAQMMGKIYNHLGLLSTGELHEVGRAELIGQYIGQTAPKVKDIIDRARGGVLFIDEAYSLIRSGEDSKDYGQEVIEILVKEISDGKGDIAIILAGYTQPMETLLESNPGLKSRFPVQFEFPDYTPAELLEIAKLTEKESDLEFTPEALYILSKKITEEYRKRDATFGNARFVKTTIREAKMNLGIRVMKMEDAKNLSKTELSTIHVADVAHLTAGKMITPLLLSIDEEELQRSMAELHALVGLSEVKKRIDELIALVRFYQQTGRNVLNQFSLHMIFKGNPGTGKTTVARILSTIYRALGVLERGQLVECDRQSLVAGFVGQTAIKTQEKINSAIGGILFIDEAYSLTSDSKTQNDFGKEALETILKQMEDKRGEFIVIAAGYTQNMEQFVEMNPGLKSRFDRTIIFKDLTTEELLEVAKGYFEQEKFILTEETQTYLKNQITTLHAQRDKYFGNARTIRTIAQEAVRQQHLRMASLSETERTEQIMQTLEKEDLEKVNFNYEDLTGKRKMGFRM
ncbi:AAA+ family ATPase [Bernardetia litoralis DSM 6794]|uniref:AAA+ family ATPase n=1 Tax=Bernardetia litoralis (strain ATCC 23117 / DSM 6794 / NBRC 15988 / NCIMB 1366 / Fx l1 / Sio-4) TaxID=880071 RepID=I4AJN5_BERLS|nr:AAA family ATPase [Bernardetia litoralis]AFM04170.1 AAA+ family ATPase [Bernardetia litoralis DSM 6794]